MVIVELLREEYNRLKSRMDNSSAVTVKEKLANTSVLPLKKRDAVDAVCF